MAAIFRYLIITLSLFPFLRAKFILPDQSVFTASCAREINGKNIRRITENDVIRVCGPIDSIIERCQKIVRQPEPVDYPETNLPTTLRIIPSTGIAILPLVQDCFYKDCSERVIKYFRISRKKERLWPVLLDLAEVMKNLTFSSNVYENCTIISSNAQIADSPYRTADGSFNNLENPFLGASKGCFNRISCPDYNNEYELFKPRKYSKEGETLPTARQVSVEVHRSKRDITGPLASLMTMQWGQFLDHDLTLTPLTKAVNKFLQCCQDRPHPDCFPIPVSDEDPFYSIYNVSCLNFVRAAPCHECGFRPREQTNFQTSFVDASMIYGSSEEETISLRGPNGRLDSLLLRGKQTMPQTESEECVMDNPDFKCFKGGDPRVNEQPGLLCMQTLWMRQHNKIADELKKLNPSWNEETVFQETRKIVGAQIQLITYRDFLPLVLGKDYIDFYNLDVNDFRNYKYDPSVDPRILNEFSAAAYRFGHTLIHKEFPINTCNDNSNKFRLRTQFNNPRVIYDGKFDNLLRGLYLTRTDKFDAVIIPDVTDHLVQTDKQNFGLDLAAFNIQRGRDVGLNPYAFYLRTLFKVKIEDFEDLTYFMSSSAISKLESVYDDIDDIDLFTGGVSETSLPDAIVGPTIGAIVGLQYHRLMYGDRYFFLNQGNVQSFSESKLQAIMQTTLAQVICHNSDNISYVTPNVFIDTRSQKRICCSKIPYIDLTPWITDSNVPRRNTTDSLSGQTCPCT